ncbi:MAG: MobA/MobL family protein, partial [Lewinella sp.]|nr:MobA/MobL family protein [Lewinella sp.]
MAHAAYRSGENIYSEQEGKWKSARTQSRISHSGILLPEGAPSGFADRTTLWNAVEEAETRKNSRLAREVLVSIPREIDPDKHRELVWQFAEQQFVSRGMAADIAIHETDARDSKPNPHAHILLTTREC